MPPPPPAPPPPVAPPLHHSTTEATGEDGAVKPAQRSVFLSQIQQGTKLKSAKHLMNDRSAAPGTKNLQEARHAAVSRDGATAVGKSNLKAPAGLENMLGGGRRGPGKLPPVSDKADTSADVISVSPSPPPATSTDLERSNSSSSFTPPPPSSPSQSSSKPGPKLKPALPPRRATLPVTNLPEDMETRSNDSVTSHSESLVEDGVTPVEDGVTLVEDGVTLIESETNVTVLVSSANLLTYDTVFESRFTFPEVTSFPPSKTIRVKTYASRKEA